MNFGLHTEYYQEAFWRLLFPSYCATCSGFLKLTEKHLCLACSSALEELRFKLEDTVYDPKTEFLDESWTLYPYESPLREILTAIKFSRKRWLLQIFKEPFGQLASSVLSEFHYDAIVPIPIDRKRLIQREFNQSEILALHISKSSGISLKQDLLVKKHSTPAQSLLGKKEREINLFRIFDVRHKQDVAGKSFMLVDDIITTGSTANAAAEVLKNHGAKRVGMMALARTELS